MKEKRRRKGNEKWCQSSLAVKFQVFIALDKFMYAFILVIQFKAIAKFYFCKGMCKNAKVLVIGHLTANVFYKVGLL